MTGRTRLQATPRHSRILFLALCLLVLSACTHTSSDAAHSEPVTPGPSGSYVVPVGAPALCAELTDVAALTSVPDAISALASAPDDAAALTALASASARASAIAAAAGTSGQYAEIAAAAQSLADQLDALAGQALNADAIAQAASALDELGAAVQPVCSMPT